MHVPKEKEALSSFYFKFIDNNHSSFELMLSQYYCVCHRISIESAVSMEKKPSQLNDRLFITLTLTLPFSCSISLCENENVSFRLKNSKRTKHTNNCLFSIQFDKVSDREHRTQC